MGRKTALTDDVAQKLLGRVREGVWLAWAAAEVGVAESSVHAWLARGRAALELDAVPEREQAFATFAEAYDLACAELARDALAVARSGSRAAKSEQWYLERRFPAQCGKRVATEVSGPGGGPVQHQVALSADELCARIDALAAGAAAGPAAGDAPGGDRGDGPRGPGGADG